MRVRGLKHHPSEPHVIEQDVAPHAGAWIETWEYPWMALLIILSHPMRVRGLKLCM